MCVHIEYSCTITHIQYIVYGLPWWLSIKNLPNDAGDMSSVLGQEDPLQKEMATHSRMLAWEIPWTEETGRQLSNKTTTLIYCIIYMSKMDLKRVLVFNMYFFTKLAFFICILFSSLFSFI